MTLSLFRREVFSCRASAGCVIFCLLALGLTSACGGKSGTSERLSAPQITTQPQSQVITEPASATFSVQASGTAPLSFQWNRNSTVIAGATSSTYATPATSAQDNGAKFSVVVTNSAGRVSSKAAILTVTLTPALLTATTGANQSATISTAFPTDLQATVTDPSGAAIADQQVIFTAPSTGASANFSGGTNTFSTTTDSTGTATSSPLTANGIAGSYVVTASVNGLQDSASFSLTNVSSSSGGSGLPNFSHVFIVLEENHSYSDVIGSSSMPYLNSLATANAIATQYYGDAHPSLPNYFELTVGAGTSITGTSGDSFSGVVIQDNIVRALSAAGKTWKSYAESLPSAGYLGGDSGAYLQHHNPFVYFSDVQQSSEQASNIVPFTQLAIDIANSSLPDFGFIVPDVNDDAHNCPAAMNTCTDAQKLTAADQWLSTNIVPLLSSGAFQNSLLIIVFDEAEDTDTSHGGGHVPAVLVGPDVRAGYQSTTLYQHESTLRLILEGLGITDLPGAAATAPDMAEFFQ